MGDDDGESLDGRLPVDARIQRPKTEDRNVYLSLSPDGRRLTTAGEVGGPTSGVLWVTELDRGLRTRLHADPDVGAAISSSAWSPDGEQVAFTADRDTAGGRRILVRQADGGGAPEALSAPEGAFLCDWSPDGKRILYHLWNPSTGWDLWYLERSEDGGDWKPHLFLKTPFEERAARFSPDGVRVAYASDESGQQEVYVQAFPGGEDKVRVSTNGGAQPRWSRDGKELFYVNGSALMAVSISMTPTFSVRSSTRLFEQPGMAFYDVSSDGRRFIHSQPSGEENPPSIRVIQNWSEEFRERGQE